MLYPVISNIMNSSKAEVVITDYSSTIAENTSNRNDLLINEARVYNSDLSNVNIVDAFTNPKENESDEYKSILDINENGMMGYLSIPKIDIKVPIYHGTSNEVLQKGVGHFEGSSFPVGGESTHSVLSAHSGLPSARLFTDLNQLVLGDMFYVYILDQVLAYKVDQVLVVEPADVEALELQKGEDYVTLVTCTPYAINTHRLLVRGTRVEYSPEVLESISVDKKLGKDDIILYASLFIVLLILLFVIIFSIKSKKKYQKDIGTKELANTNVASSTQELINTNVAGSTYELVDTNVASSTQELANMNVASSTQELVNMNVASSTQELVNTNVAGSTQELVNMNVASSTQELINTNVASSTQELVDSDIPVITNVFDDINISNNVLENVSNEAKPIITDNDTETI